MLCSVCQKSSDTGSRYMYMLYGTKVEKYTLQQTSVYVYIYIPIICYAVYITYGYITNGGR